MSDRSGVCPGCGRLLPAAGGACPSCAGAAATPLATLVVTSAGLGAPGAVLAGRYRVVRTLGQGGMGEVVEAFDQELGEHVALKFLRPELHADPQASERFRREIKLARKVTHPNVCRVFDVGHAEIDGRHATFLSMQLLPGETLAQRLARCGRLAPAEALPIVRQLAAGLAAAHEAGVIHRDFKTSNVMLLAGSGEERAVITDFGLARGHGSDASVSTQAGELVGTPAYMAPEQVEGGEITTATDVYALGVVLYEMVTGARPFGGDTPFECALRRLREPPPSPRALAPDLDRRWEDVILRCLARDPCERPPVEAIVPALVGEASEVSRPRPGRRHVVWLALALAVVGLATGALMWRELRSTSRSRSGRVRPAVAVLGFVNLAQDAGTAWLGNAFSETLGSELAASERLRQVSGEEVARLRADLGLAEVSTLAPATLLRVRELTGADIVVAGAYTVFPGQAGAPRVVTLQVSVQDTASGERRGGFAEKGTETELFELVSRAGARLREELTGGDGGATSTTLGASFGGSREAARLYSEGSARLHEFDVQAARELFEEAVRLAPEAPLVHLALADAYASLAMSDRAVESARRALALADRLSPKQRRLAEGRLAELERDWPRAIEIYAGLVRDVPDSLDYGLRLGDAQLAGGKSAQALATAEMLRDRLPPPLRDDARIDILEARAAYYLSDYTRQLEAARRGEQKARKLGARLVEARAMDAAGSAQRLLGDLDGAMESLQKARAMYAAVGSRRNVARMLNSIGHVLFDRRDLDGAIEAYRQAADGFREIGDRQNQAILLHNLAWPLFVRGDSARALEHVDESLAVLRQFGDNKELAVALQKRGAILLDRGGLAGARQALEEAADLARASGRRGTESAALATLGEVFVAADRLEEARAAFGRSAEILRQLPGLEAASRVQEVLSLCLDLEAGDAGKVLELLGPVATELSGPGDPEKLVQLLGVLVRAEAMTGHVDDADRTLGQLGEAAARSADPRVAIRLLIERAFAARHRGVPGQAREMAAEARNKARAGGFVPLELEARLEEALALRAVSDRSARQLLEALEKDARARGFLLVARKAAAGLR